MKFKFNDSEKLRKQPLDGLGIPARATNSIRKCWPDPTIGDIIDNWPAEVLIAKSHQHHGGLGVKGVKDIHAAVFSFIVNFDPNDSVRFVED